MSTRITARAAVRGRQTALDDQVHAWLRDTPRPLVSTAEVWRGLGFDQPRVWGDETLPRWLHLPGEVLVALKRLEKRGLAASTRFPGVRSLYWQVTGGGA